jgi:hypothetical protein
MSRYSCLFAQKETFENGNIKCLITCCDELPEDYNVIIQATHCLEYQLVIYTESNPELLMAIEGACGHKKTGYGIDWYDLTCEDIANVISVYITNRKCVFDFTSISDAIKHELVLTSLGKPGKITPNLGRANVAQSFSHFEFSQKSKTPTPETKTPETKTPETKTPETKIPETKKDRKSESKKDRKPETKKDRKPESKKDNYKEDKISVPKDSHNKDGKSTITHEHNVKISKSGRVPKPFYEKFIEHHCIRDDKANVLVVKFNDKFIEYLIRGNFEPNSFSSDKAKEDLFRGFVHFGLIDEPVKETVDKVSRWYVQGLRLNK